MHRNIRENDSVDNPNISIFILTNIFVDSRSLDNNDSITRPILIINKVFISIKNYN